MMNRLRMLAFLLAIILVPAGLAPAQEATSAGSQSEQESAPEDVLQEIESILEEDAVDTYRYDPQGRRDPFRSLIRGREAAVRSDVPPGVPGFLIDEIDLQGVIRSRAGLVATIKGPDNIGYTIRPGDKLYDGEVLRITPTAVYFRQEVNDPTLIERQREVVKQLDRPGGRS